MSVRFFNRLFRLVQRVEEWMLGSAMIAMAGLTIANVIARTLFNHSLTFVEEVDQFLIVVVCFVGLSYAASKGRHIRMTALYDLLGDRPRKALMIFIAASTALLLWVLAFYALRYAWGVDSRSPALGVPLRWVDLIAPIGLAMAGLQYALTVVRNLTAPDVYLSYEKKDEYEEVEPSQI